MTNLSWKYRLAIKIIDLISKTWRLSAINSPAKPAIIAFWHGSMLPVWKFFSSEDSVGVVSLSKDGEILSGLLEMWDYSLIRGSSSQSGSQVLDEICSSNRRGYILITPDGPRGPAGIFKAGAVVAAARMEFPLYLCGVKIKFYRKFTRSWDKFQFPLPFSKSELTFIGPIHIQNEASREDIAQIIKSCEGQLKEYLEE